MRSNVGGSPARVVRLTQPTTFGSGTDWSHAEERPRLQAQPEPEGLTEARRGCS